MADIGTSAIPQIMPPTIPGFQVRQATGTPSAVTPSMPTSGVPAASDAAQAAAALSKPSLTGLAGHIRARWEEAKQHRETSGVDAQFLRAKRARAQEYEPDKLAAIRAIHGPDYEPPYDPIIDVKCRALEAWLSEIILTPGDRPWSLEPTPIPDLPEDVRTTIDKIVEQRIAEIIVADSLEQGRMPTVEEVEERTRTILPAMRTLFLAEMKRKAREAVKKMEQRIDDQLTEGGWRKAIKLFLYDFVTYPAAFLKGPILKKDRRIGRRFDEGRGKYLPFIDERKIDTWERVAPDKIYPAPHASNIQGGYLFELASYSRASLYACIGIEGYKEDAIRKALDDHASGGLHEWTLLDNDKRLIEKKSTFVLGDNIDTLIYWGTASGRLLLEWGMPAAVIADAQREYEIWAEMIGNEIIMARINPSPLAEKPYYKASMVEDPDSFWNKALPDILWDIAALCSAVLRATGINAAFASGPMVDVAVDRLENPNDTSLYPQRVFRSTSKQMLESKVVNFYQPNLLVGPLGNFLELCHQVADEISGVLRMSHGGDQALPDTASSTSMLITQSSRSTKQYAKNIDVNVIEKSITAQYNTNLWENKDDEFSSPYLDAKVVARGSSSFIAKEQQAVRRNEFSATLQPEEKQILGMDGMKELLRQKIQALELDTDKLLPEDKDVIERMTGWHVPGSQPNAGGQPMMGQPEGGQQVPGGMPLQPGQRALPAPEALMAGGDRSGGRDFALFQGATA